MAEVNTIKSIDGKLPEELSKEIIAKTIENSGVMQMARPISLPANGLAIPVITGEPTAKWIGEGEAAPTGTHNKSLKHIQASKISVIEVFSNEFKRDVPGLYNELVRRLPLSIATKFDQTVLGSVAKPNNNFDNFTGCEQVGINGDTYGALVNADITVADNGYAGNGYMLSPKAKGILLSSTDNNGRPLFINSVAEGAVPMILGNATTISRGAYAEGVDANVVGVYGDWTKAMYGTVDGINVEVDKSATVDGVNLFEQGMFAVKVTAELGFAIADEDAFVVLTDGTDAEVATVDDFDDDDYGYTE